ncbi:hypothetical protein BRD56_11170 [Thermoplasmatales archaeon SW_10_69_26]|nr:MAG: hypothetical protein BRD56_11170 [Thermoplasmatales archaeon SW_10_69_26]
MAVAVFTPIGLGGASSAASEDSDGDDVPDAIEERICSNEAGRNLVRALENAGGCESLTEYEPEGPVGLLLPTEVRRGTDSDGDGLPVEADASFDLVRIDPGRAVANVTDGPSLSLPYDVAPYGSDEDPDRPPTLASIVCRGLNLVGIASPVDEDGDGYPAYAEIATSEVCLHVRGGEPYFNPPHRQVKRDVDPDDGDDAVPAGPVDLEPVPTRAAFGPDRDQDTLVESAHVRDADLTYDGQDRAGLGPEVSWQTRTLDTDDRDPGEPLPTSLRLADQDHDHVHEDAEVYICVKDDHNEARDGACLGPADHVPPLFYEYVTAPSFAHHP